MKLYKALCITGAVTLIAMVAALIMNFNAKKSHSAISIACGKFSAEIAFALAGVFTVMLIAVFIRVILETRKNKKKDKQD